MSEVLYCGDGNLKTSACYLAGVLTHHSIKFEYIPSEQRFEDKLLSRDYKAVILSDYAASNFTSEQLSLLAAKVGDGMGLIMVGGWESFVGCSGDYHKTILKDVLPVEMSGEDDRVNWSGPCVIEKANEHSILGDLPWVQSMPVIGGFNHVKCKSSSLTVLNARRFNVVRNTSGLEFRTVQTDPLLVVGNYYKGRVVAFMTDAAPHWVGGFVDWGNCCIKAQAPGAEPIEVGNWYADFLGGMVRWVFKS
jgi:uncharacterized membrane protein